MTHLEALLPLAKNTHRVAVLSFSPETIPAATIFAAAGALVETFSTPKELAGELGPKLRFFSESFLEAQATYHTMFNEPAYLATYTDVATAVDAGQLRSGFEHYALFGQHEGRNPGFNYYGGLAEYDTFLFQASEWSAVERTLAGRLLSHQRLIACGTPAQLAATGIDWMSELPSGVGIRYTPPTSWLGPARPALNRWELKNWPRMTAADLYPTARPDGSPWPRISIVTPSFNQAKFLDATLQSILKQGYPNLEIIVVDGGSTDGSLEIIHRYEDQLTHWESERDRGQSHALNKGFARATGSILTWLNSDDQLAPGALFIVADAFARHSPDVLAGRCARIADPDVVPHHFHRCDLPLDQTIKLPVQRLLDLDGAWMKGHFFHQPEVFFSRTIWERAGARVREDLFYSMDYDLWVRFAQAGATILAIPEVVAIFRQHAEQKTGGEELPFLPELRRVNREYLTQLPSA